MKKWTIVLVLLILFFGCFLLSLQTDCITRANFKRLHIGMSRRDVEKVLGQPRDYSGSSAFVKFETEISLDSLQNNINEMNKAGITRIGLWAGSSGVILVHFDGKDIVSAKFFNEVMSANYALYLNWFKAITNKAKENKGDADICQE